MPSEKHLGGSTPSRFTAHSIGETSAITDLDLLKAQNEVLKLIAQGQRLKVTLDALLRIVESQSPGMLASVLLLDSDGIHVRHGAAPSLPKSYIDLIDGQPIGPRAGSCGTAAYRGEPVFVEDVATDPLWADYRDLALKHGLRACWSTPIFDDQHRVLGTFALYFRSPGRPTERHKKQIAMVTHTASIAIVKDREHQSLTNANNRLTLALDAGRIGIWERDLDTNRVTWSKQLKEIFGNSEEGELLTFETFLQAVHVDDRPKLLKVIEAAISQRRPYDLEFRVVWTDGSIHWIAARGKPDIGSAGQPKFMRSVGLDVTERKRAQEKIRAHETQLADAQRVANFGSYEWSPATNSVVWTDELFRIFGLEPNQLEPTFEGYLQRVHPEDRAKKKSIIEDCVRNRTPFETEERILRPDGSVRWLLSKGQWLFDENLQSEKLVGTCLDITARKESEHSRVQLEEQLRHMQKMESIGRLAGGVAHDFNNLLSVIVGRVELAREALPTEAAACKNIDEIQRAAERAATLTRHLLAFSRRDVIQPTVLDLNVVVKNLTKMMSRLIPEHISLRLRIPGDATWMKADLGQVDQILMNLVVNSLDAMAKGGTLFIETANTELDESSLRAHPSAKPGRYAMLSVSDTGIGMDSATISQIFEPFFTTKPAGQGTGLGLSMVHGAVEQNGGYIHVYSQVGKGTTFKIYFPAADEAPARIPPPRELELRKGSETILLVEDDPALRDLTVTLLSGQGYKVLEAKNATSAVELAQQYAHEIEVLLTDVILPDLSGVELASQLNRARPKMRVLYMSGYPGDLLSHHGVLKPGIALLPKPFTRRDLVSRIGSLLERTT